MAVDLKDLKELAEAATESLIARELLKAETNPKTVLELIARVEAAEGEPSGSVKETVEAKADACERRLSNEYEWLKHRYDYNATPHFSDGYVASEVRMLMRDQLNHEAVVTTAANRLSRLSIESAQLRTALEQAKAREAELRSALEPFAKRAAEIEATGAPQLRNEYSKHLPITVPLSDLRNAVTAMGGDDNG